MPNQSQSAGADARILFARGPRRCEELLLGELDDRLTAVSAGGARRVVILLVPSQSLRRHVLGRIAARRGRGLAGLACVTLRGLALELASRAAAVPPPDAADPLPLLVRRHARREAALRRSLGHLRDGYGAVVGSVRDLVDAGFDPAHAGALQEALTEDGAGRASRAELARAHAVVRVAARSLETMEELELGRSSTLLRLAAELLRPERSELLAAEAVLVHGFGDATGVAADLIAALLRRYGGTAIIDQPPDPAEPGRIDDGARFTRRFAEHLETVVRVVRDEAPESPVRGGSLQGDPVRGGPVRGDPPPKVEMFAALGAEAEMREVTRRIRALLDSGVEPERIGLVARRFDPYRAALRPQLSRRGIPFSADGAEEPAGAEGRRVAALLEVLARRRQSPTERWLDAVAPGAWGAPVFDLRLALFSLGAGRLGEVEALDLSSIVAEGFFPLPVRRGYVSPDNGEAEADEVEDEPEPEARLHRRRVPAPALEHAAAAARRLGRRFDAWSRARAPQQHLRLLGDLLFEDLGWDRGAEFTARVLERLDAGLGTLTPRFELDADELLVLLGELLEDFRTGPLGGQGGGVQVLDAMAARGRTFDHLFLIGLNRAVFPRTVREDPLLPDALRKVLARHGSGVVPDLPLKAGGYDEERYLFAQLVASARRVSLSWQLIDDDNNSLTPSPLVERLRWAPLDRKPASWSHPPVAQPFPLAAPLAGEAGETPRPAVESAILVALHGGREELAAILPAVLRRGPGAAAGRRKAAVERLARLRAAVLEEQDPRRGTAAGEAARRRLGPYFGLLGAAPPDDPRRLTPLWVTTLERAAACPWQVFLERLLRLEPAPDPLGVPPAVEPLLIGDLAHRVLEAIARRGLPEGGAELSGLGDRKPAEVPWPDAAELSRLAQALAGGLLRQRGIALDGFAAVLARALEPFLEVARRLDWAERPPAVLGVEVAGRLRVTDRAGRGRPVRFKVDRVDGGGDGLELTDYKTGRGGLSDASAAATRRRRLLLDVTRGGRLQAPAYARAGGLGRLVYLYPGFDGPQEARVVTAAPGDGELAEAFQEAARIVLEGWDRGLFFPRLEEPDRPQEPRRCATCRVSEACLRGDSGARARLREWMAAGVAAGEDAGGDRRAAAALWTLPARRPTKGEGAGK